MASPTAAKKYSRQLVLIVSTDMDRIITERAAEQAKSKAEVGRAFLADGMRVAGFDPITEDAPAEAVTG